MLFYLASFIFFILGLYSITARKPTMVILLTICAIFPSSFSFSTLFSKSGLYIYDFYFIGYSLILFKRNFVKRLLTNDVYKGLLFLIFALIIYFIFSYVYLGKIDKYLLRDLRLLILCIILFISHPHSKKYTPNAFYTLTLIFAIFNFLFYLASLKGYFQYKNEYYENNSFRYFGLASYISVFFILWIHTKGTQKFFYNKIELVLYILCWGTILIAGYRALLLACIAGIIVNQKITVRNVVLLIIVSIVGVGTFLWYSEQFNVTRVTDNLSTTSMLLQLQTRYSPAADYISKLDFLKTLLGYGFGTTFDIPWFDYMDLDTKHNMVDSTYVTLFVKFGLFSLFFYFTFSRVITFYAINKKIKRSLIVFFIIFMITTPLVYHGMLPVAILYILMMSKVKYNAT